MGSWIPAVSGIRKFVYKLSKMRRFLGKFLLVFIVSEIGNIVMVSPKTMNLGIIKWGSTQIFYKQENTSLRDKLIHKMMVLREISNNTL